MDSTVLAYVTQLSNGEADTTQAAQYYEDILGVLNATVPLLVNTVSVSNASTGIVANPANTIHTLLYLFNNVQIGELSLREADWLVPNWRAATTGNLALVLNYVQESEQSNSVQLVPIPTGVTSTTIIGSYIPSLSVPAWIQMPIALLILAMEYARESSHQNLKLAKACKDLGMLLINTLLG